MIVQAVMVPSTICEHFRELETAEHKTKKFPTDKVFAS